VKNRHRKIGGSTNLPAVPGAQKAQFLQFGLSLRVLLAVWGVLVLVLALKGYPGWRDAVVEKGLWGASGVFSGVGLWAAMRGHMWGVLGVVSLVLAGLGAGAGVERLMGARSEIREKVILSLAFGWGVIGLVQQGLGEAGLYYPWVLRTEWGVLVATGLVMCVRWRVWEQFGGVVRGGGKPWVLAGCLMAAIFLMTRLPDVHEDARIYHFAAPEQYLLTHKITVEAQNPSWHMPRGAEMGVLVPWHLGGIELAKSVNLVWLLVMLGFMVGISREVYGSGEWGLWGWVLVLGSGVVVGQVWEGKNDIVVGALVSGALWGLMRASGGPSTLRRGPLDLAQGRGEETRTATGSGRGGGRWWLLSVCLLGLAMRIKYTAGFFVAAYVVAGWIWGWKEVGRAGRVMVVGVFAGAIAWWSMESWLYLGNPVAPFMAGWFETLGWGVEYQRALRELHVTLSSEEARRGVDVLSGVWRAMGEPGMGSVAVFILLPFGMLGARGRSGRIAILFMVIAYGLWAGGARLTRYMVPLLPIGGVLGAGALGSQSGGKRWLRVLGVVAVGTGWLNAVLCLAPGGLGYLAGQEGKEGYLKSRYTTWWDAVSWVNGHVLVGGRVMFTGEDRRLHLRVRVRSIAVVAEPLFWRLTKDSRDAAEVRKRVKQLGLTHQLHNFVSAEYRALAWYGGPGWDERQLLLYADFVKSYLKPVLGPDRIDYDNGGFYAFEITRKPGKYPLFYLASTEGCFHDAFAMLGNGPAARILADAEVIAARMKGVAESELILAKFYAKLNDHTRINELLEPGYRLGFIGDGSIKAYAASSIETGRIEPAIKAYCRAYLMTRELTLLRSMAFGFYARSQAAFRRGEYTKAARDMEQAARCAPLEAAPGYELARTLVKLNRFAEALYWARKAGALMPGNPEVAALSAELESRASRGGK
jgi:hypothetical protein